MGKIVKVCPNCCQLYHLKALDRKAYGNIPLFLSCGHSMCETCVRNLVKFAEPIECKTCHQDMTLDVKELASLVENKVSLYDLFPINVYMLGELAKQYINPSNENKNKEDGKCYIDLEAIVKSTETTEGHCLECHAPTIKMCKQCNIVLCLNCFNRTHKNFVIFKDHILQNIELNIVPSTCNQHKDKPQDYYCKTCQKPVCMDCFMVGGEKSCKNHDVVSIQEVNEVFITELTEIVPKIDELYRRLTKTAVEIGNSLQNMQNENETTDLTKLMNTIDQHYSKLTSQIDKQKADVTTLLCKLATAENDSLVKAKAEVENSIKKAAKFSNAVKQLDPNQLKKVNVSAILEDAKRLLEAPWYLNKGGSNDAIKLSVKEELYEPLKDYVSLEGVNDVSYKLCSTSELKEKNIDLPEAPNTPVFPPKMIADVRENAKPTDKEVTRAPTLYKTAPKYHTKTGSCSSLNSINSDSSLNCYNSYIQYKKPMIQQVQPFLESQHPRQLEEGSQELVYITHIVDPHNFFVQRACHQSKVQELLREFRNAKSTPMPSANHITEGKVYLVYSRSDQLWFRCRIMNIDRSKPNAIEYQVFCIDFGVTESVPIDQLRVLPPVRVHTPPPFAINCSLANCEPKNGIWSSDDAFLIQKIIDNKQAVIHVRRLRAPAGGGVKLECDVTTFEHGVSVAHALVFHGGAMMPQRLPYPKAQGIAEKPKIFISNNDFKQNSIEEVMITHIVSPDNFFIRKCHQQGVYEKLCADLEQEYHTHLQSNYIYLPEKNMACVARPDKNSNEWFRAVIKDTPGQGRVRIVLLDCGATLLLHWTALRRIHPKFTTLKALATECHLAGVTPVNNMWSQGSVALLKRFENKSLELHVEDNRNRNSIGVTLYDKTDPDNELCVNKLMVQHKYAVTFGIYRFNDTDHTEQVYIKKSPKLTEKPIPKGNNKKKAVAATSKQSTDTEDDLKAKHKGPLRLEAKVLNCQSPSLIYVSLVQQQKTYNEMFDSIQKYYSKATDAQVKWNVGDRCVCLCIQSKTWRRAAILEIMEDNVKVFYSDFAFVETVPMNSLRKLAKEFTEIGDGAIMCHLYGVTPAVGEEWPSLTKEFLKELLDAYQRIFITKTGSFKGKSMPVELWVYHTIQGGALEPNKSEWRCLNKKIIEQGLAIPDRSEEATLDTDTEKTGDNALAFLNMAGSVNDWLQIESLPSKPFQAIQDMAHSSNRTTPDPGEPGTSNTPNVELISDWKQADDLKSNEFTAIPTNIDDNAIIYLHEIDQEATLEMIRKALDVRFQKPDPKAKYAKWTVGEPCIAQFYLDNKFHRARVVEVNDSSTCRVHFVDYGNEEVCSFENMRKSILMYQIPIQSHKCVMSRIKPIGKKWDVQILEYIHKAIVDKQCFVKVIGETVDGITPIDLKIDKLWMSDHLVDLGVAKYTDGSKTVVRKYAPSMKSPEPVDESDSGPDYIISKDDNFEKSSDFSLPGHGDSIEVQDWNKLMKDDDEDEDCEFVSYTPYNETEFECNVTVVNDVNTLELSIVWDHDKNLQYEKIFKELEEEGSNFNPLNGILANKACAAIFPDDGLWYRAAILQYSQVKGQVKVKYVDYGNIAVVSLADVREITDKYLQLPPATISAKLHDVTVNPAIDVSKVAEEYSKVFLDNGPFHAKVMQWDGDIPSVQLKINDELAYKSLYEKRIFLKKGNPEVKL
ncbi:RING finger protein 17 isoform X2 [Leptidea sinapis]|uniref:RING finger protein 17 isoform X2 n=1 Tax=Leptidea sinapis TaxID=189913 RepID=UPI0021C3955C|nr:RING finger protein 17 isoform X2 [Leptidea sinapis]